MHMRCLVRYDTLVKSGSLDSDEAQLQVIAELDSILNLADPPQFWSGISYKTFWGSQLFKNKQNPKKRGLYLHGGVGTGKSMLMDIFFDEIRSKRKMRTHFHSFMQDTHDKINNVRRRGVSDPISIVANEISKRVSTLCFDEFQIMDITDAMLVGRLFSILIANRTFIVTTSNRPPDDLYKDGLNRQVFLPFIELLKKHLYVMKMDARKDYRREKLVGSQTYFAPVNGINREGFDKMWKSLVRGPSKTLELKVKSRTVKLAQYSNGVGRSSFRDLCGKPLGPLDYLIICDNVKVLFIENIPILSALGMDSAKRFVTLVDSLYEKQIKIVCLAEERPEMLYSSGSGVFEFERTISRLYEMQSKDWLTKATS